MGSIAAALAQTLREVRLRRAVGSAARPSQSAARAAGPGRAGAGAVPGELFRFQRAPFPREAARAARHRAQLHLGEAGPAGSRTGAQGSATGSASPAASASPPTGDAAASGRQFTRLVGRGPSLRSAGGAR